VCDPSRFGVFLPRFHRTTCGGIIYCGLVASAPAAGAGDGPLLSPLDVAAGPSPAPAAGFEEHERASYPPGLEDNRRSLSKRPSETKAVPRSGRRGAMWIGRASSIGVCPERDGMGCWN
jgi:hypothetical protein